MSSLPPSPSLSPSLSPSALLSVRSIRGMFDGIGFDLCVVDFRAPLRLWAVSTIELKMATLGLATLKAKRRTAIRSKKCARLEPANMDEYSPSALSVLAMLTLLDWFHGPRNCFHGPSATATASKISSPCQPEFDSCLNFSIHIRKNLQWEDIDSPMRGQ